MFKQGEIKGRRYLAWGLCAAMLACGALGTVAAVAQEPEAGSARKFYSIPAGPLGRTLSTFAGQAGVTLSFDPALTQNLYSNGLSGAYGVRQGLAQLLKGSRLEAVPGQDGS